MSFDKCCNLSDFKDMAANMYFHGGSQPSDQKIDPVADSTFFAGDIVKAEPVDLESWQQVKESDWNQGEWIYLTYGRVNQFIKLGNEEKDLPVALLKPSDLEPGSLKIKPIFYFKKDSEEPSTIDWRQSRLIIEWRSRQRNYQSIDPLDFYWCGAYQDALLPRPIQRKEIKLGDLKDGKIYLDESSNVEDMQEEQGVVAAFKQSLKDIKELPVGLKEIAWFFSPVLIPAFTAYDWFEKSRFSRRLLPNTNTRTIVSIIFGGLIGTATAIPLGYVTAILEDIALKPPITLTTIEPCPDRAIPVTPKLPEMPPVPVSITPDPVVKSAVDRLSRFCAENSRDKWAMRTCLSASLSRSGIYPDAQGKCPAGSSIVPPFLPNDGRTPLPQGSCFMNQSLAQQAVCVKYPSNRQSLPPGSMRIHQTDDVCPAR